MVQIRRLLPLMGMEAADFVGLSCCHRAWKNTKKSKPSSDGFSTSWIMEFARPMTAVWWATGQEDWFSAWDSPSSRPPAPAQLARWHQFKLLGAEAEFLTCALKDHRGTGRKVKKSEDSTSIRFWRSKIVFAFQDPDYLRQGYSTKVSSKYLIIV